MTRVTVEGTEIVVRLGPREALAARRRTIRVPVAALRALGVDPSWWRVLRGTAGRGLWLPGRCVGRRHGPAGTDFVAVRAESPVLWMDLAPEAPFARVAVTVPDPEQTERALRVFMPEEPLIPDESGHPGMLPEPGRREGREEPDKPPDPEERRMPGVPGDTGHGPGPGHREKLWEKPWEAPGGEKPGDS
ncbi:hypothetical protein KV205_06920 [Streptomyces sp. SKN60]|uniref:hypothetical protein n=1 Tax=Streptomyces sp. SKN60 TaxID=2855506 RepID=UPI0022474B43|nr:hypothetical protein [Streptomyces sp. SKN60]MCX2180262.1 hypothetical protein [Streptomyces sp. SKN60]